MATATGGSQRPRRLSTAAKRRLRRHPPPEHIAERTTEHGEVLHYLEGWRVIQLANAIFGEDRWGAEVVGEVTYQPIPQTGRRNATLVPGIYTATVRVTVDGCPPHSDLGAAAVEEQTPEQHATAAKAAVTDALKRALRHYGPAFGSELAVSEGSRRDGGGATETLQDEVIALGERGGAEAEQTREWVVARYGCPLDLLDRRRLEDAVAHLSRGLDRRNGQQAA